MYSREVGHVRSPLIAQSLCHTHNVGQSLIIGSIVCFYARSELKLTGV